MFKNKFIQNLDYVEKLTTCRSNQIIIPFSIKEFKYNYLCNLINIKSGIPILNWKSLVYYSFLVLLKILTRIIFEIFR